MANRPLVAEGDWIASLLERESKGMDPLQVYRELVQNEIEAGATNIIIDGWKAPNGHLLARVSGNGHGMTAATLLTHLAKLKLIEKKGFGNYNIGARVAALPLNPAGVTFASRTSGKDGMNENKIMLFKDKTQFATKAWSVKVTDEAGEVSEELHEVVAPSHKELSEIGSGTGTAVILHGHGRGPTWDISPAYKVHNFLARRYYAWPGNVEVKVRHPDVHNKVMAVVPFGSSLARWKEADGEVKFTDVAGLSGSMFWWVLPKPEDLKDKLSGHNYFGSGIGVVVDDEVFHYSKQYMSDFGIPYKSAQNRIVILIHVDGAQMDTSRSAVVFPTARSDRKTVPWKAFGQYLSEHMPAEIDEIMTKVIVSDSVFTDEAAKKLDPNWFKWIKPVMVHVPVKHGAPLIGDESGSGLPTGEVYDEPENPWPIDEPKPKHAAHRLNAGTDPGVTKPKVVTPRVEFVDPSEMPEDHPHIMWVEMKATVQISTEFPPFMREVKRWLEKTDHPKSLVESAVKQAYSLEYSAFIIDANGQRSAKLPPAEIEALKLDSVLYGKALGCQSLTQMIEVNLRNLVKAA
jgi:hypothetical protein